MVQLSEPAPIAASHLQFLPTDPWFRASSPPQIAQKSLAQMFARGRTTSFFMGSFEDARKRRSFSVLGVSYLPEGIGTRVGFME